MEDVNSELKQVTKQSPACYLGTSTLATRDDMLGMFTARDIESGECMLVDRTATATCSHVRALDCMNCFARIQSLPLQVSCCPGSYCSRACLELSLNTYHKVVCEQDFTWLFRPAQGLQHNASPLRPLLMLRILASCIQSGPEAHPLDHPRVARLQPLARNNHVDVFTMAESVITPMRILEQLSVDAFRNLNFDTMILHTM